MEDPEELIWLLAAAAVLERVPDGAGAIGAVAIGRLLGAGCAAFGDG